jgi:hypothetical protein
LNWSLIAAIEDNSVIKQGLFPLPSETKSVKKGGKPKTEYQWVLAMALFGTHIKYKEVFAQAKTTKEKNGWTLKIKNRLKW